MSEDFDHALFERVEHERLIARTEKQIKSYEYQISLLQKALDDDDDIYLAAHWRLVDSKGR